MSIDQEIANWSNQMMPILKAKGKRVKEKVHSISQKSFSNTTCQVTYYYRKKIVMNYSKCSNNYNHHEIWFQSAFRCQELNY